MRKLSIAGFALAALGFGGCAQQPSQMIAAKHGKEYFPSSIYGRASRRVVADGQPIPRGGGQYLVGKPYTIAGQTYVPSERKIVQVGLASWYGDAFHGRLTANGEVYDRDSFSAAHPTMPLPSYARVTNLSNHSSMIVRVNDRGPYASNRVMDVSRRVAEALDFKRYGTARVRVEYVGRASLAGSDDVKLYATLRTDGPARWQAESPVLEAEAPLPRVHLATLAPYVPAPHAVRTIEQRHPEPIGRPREASTILARRDGPPREGSRIREPERRDGASTRIVSIRERDLPGRARPDHVRGTARLEALVRTEPSSIRRKHGPDARATDVVLRDVAPPARLPREHAARATGRAERQISELLARTQRSVPVRNSATDLHHHDARLLSKRSRSG